MPLTKKQEKKYKKSKKRCHIWKEEFDKNEKNDGEIWCCKVCKVKFTDNLWFVASSLSTLPNNLAKALYKEKRKDYTSSLEHVFIKDSTPRSDYSGMWQIVW